VVPDRLVAEARITIVGHATALLQVRGLNIVTDPLWSERASPVGFAGPKRVSPPAIAFDNLPRIDVVLLSHNHYDHLDIATLRRLIERDQPLIVTPLGNDAIVRKAIPDANVRPGDWWDRQPLSEDVEAIIIPAQHWSARGLGDRRMALWCGFAVRTPTHLIYFAGDTGYGDGDIFQAFRQTLGSPDVALLPIGAYAPRWFMEAHHINPEEAVLIMQDLGASQAIGIHWGVFQLSDEGRDDPRAALALALAERQIPSHRFPAAEPGYVWESDDAKRRKHDPKPNMFNAMSSR
jgi:L-ascorbate metabolism protein UlaG (beta-lactamase superfamily)